MNTCKTIHDCIDVVTIDVVASSPGFPLGAYKLLVLHLRCLSTGSRYYNNAYGAHIARIYRIVGKFGEGLILAILQAMTTSLN